MFQAIAEGETIHALKHLRHMKAVRSTRENIEEAMSGEMRLQMHRPSSERH